MPIYEYRCSACGEKFEKLIRSTSASVQLRCPNCGAEEVDREISMFGLSSGGSTGSSFSSSANCAPSGGG